MVVHIKHERWKCIECGSCAVVAPEFWEMDPKDNKADLKGAPRKEVPEGILEELDLDDEHFQENKDAADSCPVECIHVTKKEQA